MPQAAVSHGTGRLDDSSVHDTRMAGKPKLFWLILIVLITRAHRPVDLYYAAGGWRRNNRSRERGNLLIAIKHNPVSACAALPG